MIGNSRARIHLVSITLAVALISAPSAATASTTALASTPASLAASTLVAPKVMAALGDSISRASSADGTGRDNLPNSWSTGTAAAVQSHRTRIVASTGSTPTAYNLARGGTETSDLPDQAALAVSLDADYVTVLSGANNVCHSASVADLPTVQDVRADFDKTLKILGAGLPSAKIFVASIPSLMSLYQVAHDDPVARLIWAAVGVCPVMLADPTDDSAAAQSRRSTVEHRVDQLNIAIAAACAAVLNCTYDDDAVHSMKITMDDISTRDYFHPSVAGQAKIAAATWAKVVAKGVLDAPFAAAPAPVVETVENTSTSISWSGAWATTGHPSDSGGSVSYLKEMSASYSLRFVGNRISIASRTTPSAGISEIRIDGTLVARVDSYSETTQFNQVVFVSRTLAQGAHTISVTPTHDKSAPSSGRNLILDALIVESAG